MLMFDNEFETKENKIWTRIILNHNKSSGILFLDLFLVILYDFIHGLKS